MEMEILSIGNKKWFGLLWCMDGRINRFLDRKVVGIMCFEMIIVIAMIFLFIIVGYSVV